MADIPVMLSLREASKRSGLSYYNLRTLCLKKKIVYAKVGKGWLINYNSLLNYLNTGVPAYENRN